MRKIYMLAAALLLSPFAFGSSGILHNEDALTKRFITNNKSKPDDAVQERLRASAEWKSFKQQHGDWWVQFNETNNKPHRAFGTPIQLPNLSPDAAASFFLTNYAGAWIPSNVQLVSAGKFTENEKYYQPNFIQTYNGLEVLWSRATVKMTKDYRAIMFGADVYDDIQISTTASLSTVNAAQHATKDISNSIVSINNGGLKILPIPSGNSNNYRLVYELTVKTIGSDNIPANYYTLVDANDGTILYRKNKVEHFASEINVTGTLYPTQPYNPSQTLNLQYIKVTDPQGTNYTDVNGFINLNTAAPFTATFNLEGLWAQVFLGQNGNTITPLTATINAGSNTISLNPAYSIQEITAYYHTNIVHDFMKSKLSTFTSLDFPISVKVDRTDGTCNAFYDGGINFYTTAGGCNALSQVNDVVYHEYGHGISNIYWSDHGLNFSNGGMGEGYSDVWAICITNEPTLGLGFSSSDPNTFVRDYDFANGATRKVYPQDIAGEVHADGEIIAGAWWSTALNMGSTTSMANLFTASLAGLANGPDGSEGQVYTDILIDALEADDNDADLTNGTPNSAAIVPAFAAHGITLVSNAELTHTPITNASYSTPITLNASLTNVQFAWALQGVKGAYKVNNDPNWTPLTFTDMGGYNFVGIIPPQANGTIISYYLGIEDINGTVSNVKPAGANDVEPNLPFYTLVGFSQIFTEDFDNTAGAWIEGLPGDNATTGIWEQNIPEQTDVNGVIVQPAFQHTFNGLICYVTGAASLGAAGGNDIDGGKTSLQSPTFDLTGYTNPAFEYYRWYTNDQGATPKTDYWQVSASADGINYLPIENTRVADHSFRQFVFRVNDLFPGATELTFRFVAEDANAGSLVEALLDDLTLYNEMNVGLNEIQDISLMSAAPNPASSNISVQMMLNKSADYSIQLVNLLGQTVYSSREKLSSGKNTFDVPVSKIQSGLYLLKAIGPNAEKSIKVTIIH
jgi:Zn-dependent metalloprotease